MPKLEILVFAKMLTVNGPSVCVLLTLGRVDEPPSADMRQQKMCVYVCTQRPADTHALNFMFTC